MAIERSLYSMPEGTEGVGLEEALEIEIEAPDIMRRSMPTLQSTWMTASSLSCPQS
jgi:hypothetical protein